MDITGDFYNDAVEGVAAAAILFGWIVFLATYVLIVEALMHKQWASILIALLIFSIPYILFSFMSSTGVHPTYTCREDFYTSDGCVGGRYRDAWGYFIISGWIGAPTYLASKASKLRGKT